jgi:hypothetical protein
MLRRRANPGNSPEVGKSQANPSSGFRRLMGSHKLRMLLLMLLTLAALVSSTVAVKEALAKGVDFQWSGARLIGLHQDPWETFIGGDAKHQIVLGQQPNYLPELYLVILPLGKMKLSTALMYWCVINLVLLAATLLMVGRMFRLSGLGTVVLTLLTLASTPFRVAMANGQQSIFILFMLTVVFYAGNTLVQGIALGLSYAKYSFSPMLVFLLLFKKRFGLVLISIVPPVLGLLVVWWMLGGSVGGLAIEPLQTAKIAVGSGEADLMTLSELMLRGAGASAQLFSLVPTVAGFGVALLGALLIARQKDLNEAAQFALVLILTLFCFKHLIYDFVVLIVPLAQVLITRSSKARMIVLLCIAYFWFGTTIMHRVVSGAHAPLVLFNGVILVIMALAAARSSRHPEGPLPTAA